MLKQVVIILILLSTASCSRLLYDCSMLGNKEFAKLERQCAMKKHYKWCKDQTWLKCDYLGTEKSYYKKQEAIKNEN